MEVLLGIGADAGRLDGAGERFQIPLGVAGQNMTGTGWYNVIDAGRAGRRLRPELPGCERAAGGRSVREHGVPFGGGAEPDQRREFAAHGEGAGARAAGAGVCERTGPALATSSRTIPAWILLDVLRRSGWARIGDRSRPALRRRRHIATQTINAIDLNGNPITLPRFQMQPGAAKPAQRGRPGARNSQLRAAVSDLRAGACCS